MHRKFHLRKCRLLSILILFKIWIVYYVFQSHTTCEVNGNEGLDVVYTWVNGSDPNFIRTLHKYTNASNNQDVLSQRFDDKYELKFSLRSLEKYMPWVRNVYIVTNGQIPYWLNLDYEKVRLVTHDDIFIDPFNLPTFSSPAIETHLHRIPGLSKRFLYFNDDFFIGKPVYPEDFLSANRGFLVYLAWPIPMCATDCPWLYVGDGQCDASCLHIECQMDGGDCSEDHILGNSGHIDDMHVTNTKDNKNVRYLFINKTERIGNLVAEHNTNIMHLNKLRRKKRAKNITNDDDGSLEFDTYTASLQHTNRVLNSHYGFEPRYTVAHSPILIDRGIMQDMQDLFQEEFAKTSKNRVRHTSDMQYQLSYYYYLMSESVTVSFDEMFNNFDTDGSGTWSDREIRTLLTQIYELPLSYASVDHFEGIITNCSKHSTFPKPATPEYERYVDSNLPTVSKDLVRSCRDLVEVMAEKFGSKKRYKYEIVKNAQNTDVTFVMLNSNVNEVVRFLDDIRKHKRKFVCINDNLDENGAVGDKELVKAILHDFFLALFPSPSQFELPPDFRNRFLQMNELRTWKQYHLQLKLVVYVCVVILALLMYLSFCRPRYCSCLCVPFQ